MGTRIDAAFSVTAGGPPAHTTAGARLGHAVWLRPGETSLADERLVAAGLVEPEQHMDEASLARFGSFMEQCASAHERLLPGHWNLLILGVNRRTRGAGWDAPGCSRCGRALVKSASAIDDRAGSEIRLSGHAARRGE